MLFAGCVLEYERAAAEIGTPNTSAIMHKSMDSVCGQDSRTQALVAGNEHPRWDGNHSHKTSKFAEPKIANNERCIKVGFAFLEVFANEFAESWDEKICAHIRRIRNHAVILPC